MSFKAVALPLTIRGWYVFPVSPQKKPLIKWASGATLSPTDVMRWDQKWPDALCGIATGPSGLLVVDLDLDPEKGLDGPTRWRELIERDDREVPPTYTVGTRRGGQHLYFRGTGRTTASVLADGIDTRGRGGYVIAWPNVLDAREPAVAPEWLLKVTKPLLQKHTPEQIAQYVVPEANRRSLSLRDLRHYAALHPTSPSGLDALAVAEGRAWGVKGGRDVALSRLAYALMSFYPWLDPEATADLFTRSCEAVQREDGRDTDAAWVAQKLRSKIFRAASDQATVASSQRLYDETLIYLNAPPSKDPT